MATSAQAVICADKTLRAFSTWPSQGATRCDRQLACINASTQAMVLPAKRAMVPASGTGPASTTGQRATSTGDCSRAHLHAAKDVTYTCNPRAVPLTPDSTHRRSLPVCSHAPDQAQAFLAEHASVTSPPAPGPALAERPPMLAQHGMHHTRNTTLQEDHTPAGAHPLPAHAAIVLQPT